MNLRIDGKVVLLTGASSGIGRHLAGTLAAAGGRVVLGARRIEALEERVAEIHAQGGEAIAVALDVRDRASVSAFFDTAETRLGPADILVNNAGMEAGAMTYADLDDAGWDAVMETNLRGAWWMARELTARVVKGKRAGAVVVNMSSITAERTTKGIFPYAVSKAGLNQATQVMALEARSTACA